MHIISLCSASFLKLISLYEGTAQRIVLLEFKISWGSIIAKSTCNCEILWTSIKYDSSRLRNGWSHKYCSHINRIISACQWYLKLQVILFVFWFICTFAYKLLLMNFSLWLSLRFCLNSCINRYIWKSVNVQLRVLCHEIFNLKQIWVFFLHLCKARSNIIVLLLPKLWIILLSFIYINLDLIINLSCLFNIFDIDMRNVMLLKFDPNNSLANFSHRCLRSGQKQG